MTFVSADNKCHVWWSEAKERKANRKAVTGSQTQAPWLEPPAFWIPSYNHQLSQSSTCTAQVALTASVAHLAVSHYVPSEFGCRSSTAKVSLSGESRWLELAVLWSLATGDSSCSAFINWLMSSQAPHVSIRNIYGNVRLPSILEADFKSTCSSRVPRSYSHSSVLKLGYEATRIHQQWILRQP